MSDVRAPPPGYVRNQSLFGITYIYVVLGGITLFMNLPLAAYLLKTTRKDQKELIVIIALSISDIICAAQFLGMGIYRFTVWFDEVHFISQAACNRTVTVASYQLCLQIDNFFGLVIALDRLFAVMFPVRYNKYGTGYTVLLVMSPVGASVLGYVTHLIAISVLPVTFVDEICFNYLSVRPEFRVYLTLQRMLCVFIPTLIYIFIYIRMRIRIGHSNSGLSKGMRHLTKTVAYITLASFFLVFVPEVWWYFGLFGGLDPSLYFIFILSKKIVSFFIHTVRHRELMKHVKKYLPRKLTTLIHHDKQSNSAVFRVKIHRDSSQQITTVMR